LGATAAVADESQVIAATGVTREADDRKQVQPRVEAIKGNLDATAGLAWTRKPRSGPVELTPRIE